jgi:hypothetical protein
MLIFGSLSLKVHIVNLKFAQKTSYDLVAITTM